MRSQVVGIHRDVAEGLKLSLLAGAALVWSGWGAHSGLIPSSRASQAVAEERGQAAFEAPVKLRPYLSDRVLELFPRYQLLPLQRESSSPSEGVEIHA